MTLPMTTRAVIAALLIGSTPTLAMPQRRAASAQTKAPTLAQRFAPPPGYSAEQDVESEGARSFSTAADVRGHIIRRFVQAGDDGPMAPWEIARYFAELLHTQGGAMYDDRVSSTGGRLDGRIPGARPVWLHVDINDSGNVLDIIALEEAAASTKELPLEETTITGTWTNSSATPELNAAMSRAFSPYQGWAWKFEKRQAGDATTSTASSTVSQMQLTGRSRSQLCATCPIGTDTADLLILTIDVNRLENGLVSALQDDSRVLVTRAGRQTRLSPPDRAGEPFIVIDLPWKRGIGEVSLYQHDLVEALLSSPKLTDLVK